MKILFHRSWKSTIDALLESWLCDTFEAESQKGLDNLTDPDEKIPPENSAEEQRRLHRWGNQAEAAETCEYENESDLFDSYFTIFRAVRLKRQKLLSLDARKTIELRAVYFNSRTSIEALVDLLERQLKKLHKDDTERISQLTRCLVTLWEIEAFCLEGLKIKRLRSEIKLLINRIRRLKRQTTEYLSASAHSSENGLALGAPFKDVPFNSVLKWFHKELRKVPVC